MLNTFVKAAVGIVVIAAAGIALVSAACAATWDSLAGPPKS